MSKEYLEAFNRVIDNIPIMEMEKSYYTLEDLSNDTNLIREALQRLESIDNANPSEALETLKDMLIGNGVNDNINDYVDNLILPIKEALLKAQEPKKYLKWEDLEKDRTYKVLLNGNQYELVKRYDDYECHCDYITLQKKPNVSIFIYEYEKEIFNDLHLERVEE